MGYEIHPRVERQSSAGLVLTHQEVEAAVAVNIRQRGSAAGEYEAEVPQALHNIALAAEYIGQRACSRGEVDCGLKCSSVSLADHRTIYDGQLGVVCKLPDCDDTGVKASFNEFRHHELPAQT